ncbi:hypothetical protein IW147_001123 [Coemansia sp. RSA 720]|nr:hypothetical protein IW147_001123 [Coemansia sp. RSA 720]
MCASLTAEQAAQRLLTAIDTLERPKPQTKGKPGKPSTKPKLDSSSISWAFHDSVDTTGLLRWLAENVDAAKNGLTTDELELLTYLDRIDYRVNSTLGDEGNAAGAALSACELRRDEATAKAKVDQLQLYAETIRNQSSVLANRADRVSAELAELQEEEERLKKAAKASDAEVARLTASYTGMLDETALAAKSTMSRLQAEPPNSSYFYQNMDEIDRLGVSMDVYLSGLHERLGEQLAMADTLPSPWSEFQPLSTQSISELLQLAQMEHCRLGKTASELVTANLKLAIERELVQLVDEEVSRMQSEDHASLLRRLQRLTGSAQEGEFSEHLNTLLGEHTERMSEKALEKSSGALVLPETNTMLARLCACFTELADMQSDRLGQVLESALQDLKPREQAMVMILRSLADERDLLNGWNKLWSIDVLRKHASSDNSASVIPPDDMLALSIKRLLGVYSKVGQSVLTSDSDQANSFECADATIEDQRALLAAGAFTGWDALLADTKAHKKIYSNVQNTVLARAKAAASIERQMDCSLSDLSAATHGGDTYSGTEAVDVLPVAAMLAEEPRKAVASDYAALFCQYY